MLCCPRLCPGKTASLLAQLQLPPCPRCRSLPKNPFLSALAELLPCTLPTSHGHDSLAAVKMLQGLMANSNAVLASEDPPPAALCALCLPLLALAKPSEGNLRPEARGAEGRISAQCLCCCSCRAGSWARAPYTSVHLFRGAASLLPSLLPGGFVLCSARQLP